jgi:hypothetical protein
MSQPRIITVQICDDDDDDKHVTHEIDAEDIAVPHDVQMVMHRSGACDYNTARALNLSTLFDLLTA